MQAKRKCRVCGKEYEACHSTNRVAGVFRWQEVACSPECGSIYLKRINESRGMVEPAKKMKHKKEQVIEEKKPAAVVTIESAVQEAPVEAE